MATAERLEVTDEVMPVALHRFIEIKDATTGEVITVVELVSPSNKVGEGRVQFERKRRRVHDSDTNWLEIDLLRGRRTFSVPRWVPASAYLAFSDERGIVDGGHRRRQFITPMELRQPLPTLAVPLRPDEAAITLPMQAVLDRLYDEAAYDGSVDYAADPPAPALGADDAAWADALLKAKGLRPAAA